MQLYHGTYCHLWKYIQCAIYWWKAQVPSLHTKLNTTECKEHNPPASLHQIGSVQCLYWDVCKKRENVGILPKLAPAPLPRVWEHHDCEEKKSWLFCILGPVCIWVSFPRTGKIVKMWPFFLFFWSFAVTKRLFFVKIFNCSGPIMSLALWNYFCFATQNFFWYPAMIIFLPYLPIFELRLPYEKALVWLYLQKST